MRNIHDRPKLSDTYRKLYRIRQWLHNHMMVKNASHAVEYYIKILENNGQIFVAQMAPAVFRFVMRNACLALSSCLPIYYVKYWRFFGLE